VSAVAMKTMESDFDWICRAEWEEATLEQISSDYGLDYSDLSERVELSGLMVAYHDHDDLEDWTMLGVRWSARLNAVDPVLMHYYDIVAFDPDGDTVTRHYQIRTQESVP
jgi:hypothetical protein